MFFQLCYIFSLLSYLCDDRNADNGLLSDTQSQSVNHEQNIIEKHTIAWQHDGESEAVPHNKRIVRQGKDGFVKKEKERDSQRNSRREWEKRSLAHGEAEENGT